MQYPANYGFIEETVARGWRRIAFGWCPVSKGGGGLVTDEPD
jgi:hypothetical protein